MVRLRSGKDTSHPYKFEGHGWIACTHQDPGPYLLLHSKVLIKKVHNLPIFGQKLYKYQLPWDIQIFSKDYEVWHYLNCKFSTGPRTQSKIQAHHFDSIFNPLTSQQQLEYFRATSKYCKLYKLDYEPPFYSLEDPPDPKVLKEQYSCAIHPIDASKYAEGYVE